MTTHDLRALYENSDALQLAHHIRSGDVTAPEVLETAITLIEERNPALNAVVIKTYDIGREAARRTLHGPFGGVPFLLKNIGSMWKGTPLTNGFPHMVEFICDHDNELVRKIRTAGFALLGRTNTPEGGWSIGTEPRLYGATINPWSPAITPGGSSGGAAAAVSSRLVPIAEASDGGGSIRVPASCCGLVGLKPSRGRITYGPNAPECWMGSVSTFCLTRTVRDTAAYLDAVSGTLPGDPYTAPKPDMSWLEGISQKPRKLYIGYTRKPAWNDPLAPEVGHTMEKTLKRLEDLGHHVVEHDIALDLRTMWFNYNRLNAVESARDLKQFETQTGRAVRDDELAPVNRNLRERGRVLTGIDHSDTVHALRRASHLIASDIGSYDVFLTPTLSQLPRPIGYWSMESDDLDAYLDRWSDAGYMFCFNISGLPAISLPAALVGGNIPVGMQFVARHGEEATLLALAQQLQEVVKWHQWRPFLS